MLQSDQEMPTQIFFPSIQEKIITVFSLKNQSSGKKSQGQHRSTEELEMKQVHLKEINEEK